VDATAGMILFTTPVEQKVTGFINRMKTFSELFFKD